MKQKAEWELRMFRAQLGDDFETECTLKAQVKCPRKDLNMHKRLPVSALLNKERTNSSSRTAEKGLVHSEENGILSTPLTSKSKSRRVVQGSSMVICGWTPLSLPLCHSVHGRHSSCDHP